MSFNKTILFLFCICFYSCNDDIGGVIIENADINLRIASKFDGETFLVTKSGQSDHEYVFGSKTLKFTNFNFFLSNFALLIQNTEDNIALDEIEYFNPTLFDSKTAADNGILVNLGRAPTKTIFDQLNVGFGVSGELNRSKPSEYGGNHPLSNSELYLEEVGSYIFLILEGDIDQNNDGVYEDSFSYKLIFEDSYIDLEIALPDLEVFADQDNEILMELDVHTLLQNINFDTQLSTSNSDFDPIMTILRANFGKALVIK